MQQRFATLHRRGNRWQIYYRDFNGKRRRVSAGANEKVAEQMLLQFNTWLFQGKDPIAEQHKLREEQKSSQYTLRSFYPMFMENHGKQQTKNTQSMYRQRFKHISRCPDVCDIPLNEITKSIVTEYMNARSKEGASNATVNREATMIKGMLSRAFDWGIISANQLHGLKLFKEAEKRNVTATPKDITRLVSYLSEMVGNIVKFAVYTGFRKENILSLTVDQVDFDNHSVRLVTKGKKSQWETYPLSKNAMGIIRKALGNRDSGYVFASPRGGRYKSISSQFSAAVKKAGLKTGDTWLRFHDLRHVFANWMHESGASLDHLRVLMGHKDRGTTDRYTTISMHDASKLLDNQPEIGGEDG